MKAKAFATLAAVVALYGGTAMAQQAGGSLGTNAETGSAAKREGTQTQQRDMKIERKADRTYTVSASTVVVPAMAAVRPPAGFDFMLQDERQFETGEGPRLLCKVGMAIARGEDPRALVEEELQGLEKLKGTAAEKVAGEVSNALKEMLTMPERWPAWCIATRMRKYITSMQKGWPFDPGKMPTDTVKQWVAVVTLVNVQYLEFAARLAGEVKNGVYRDRAAVGKLVEEMLIRDGADALVRQADAVQRLLDHPELMAVNLDFTGGSCLYGWEVGFDGFNYHFCGTGAGWKISIPGGTYFGDGWLAGSKIDVAFGETGTTTVTNTSSATSTTGTNTGATSSSGMKVGQ